jgi:hypothetical protein
MLNEKYISSQSGAFSVGGKMIEINIIVLIIMAVAYALILTVSLVTVHILGKRCKELVSANEKLTHQQQALRELNKYINR